MNIRTSASACVVYTQRPTNAVTKYTKKRLLRLQAVRPSWL